MEDSFTFHFPNDLIKNLQTQGSQF